MNSSNVLERIETAVPGTPFLNDVTLRDGNQALRKPWNPAQKLQVFDHLLRLGVQGIELGYPGASEMDFESAAQLASAAPAGVTVGVLARTNEQDVGAALKALSRIQDARPLLHTFIGMSPYHMNEVLRRSPDDVRKMAVEAVAMARKGLGGHGDVQFSAEHFGDCRENLPWVIESFQACVEAGANVINLPNTVERYRPAVFVEMVRHVIAALPRNVRVSVHCHDDLGMGTATTVESFFAGAQQLEVTMNGLGERAGNTNLWEVVCALHGNKVTSSLNFGVIYEVALAIAEISGVPIPEKAPLIGADVLKHRSGIHQHGAIQTFERDKRAYLPIDPKLIGRAGDEELEFTSQSGAAAVETIVREEGHMITREDARLLQPALKAVSEHVGALTPEELASAYLTLVALREKKESVSPEDVMAVVRDVIIRDEQLWQIIGVQAIAGTSAQPSANVCLRRNGSQFTGVALGDGPVDATFKAIEQVTGVVVTVSKYHIGNITGGADSQGNVIVGLQLNGSYAEADGTDTDIVVASARAYIRALNALIKQSA